MVREDRARVALLVCEKMKEAKQSPSPREVGTGDSKDMEKEPEMVPENSVSLSEQGDNTYTSDDASDDQAQRAPRRAPAGIKPPAEPFSEPEVGENIWEGKISSLRKKQSERKRRKEAKEQVSGHESGKTLNEKAKRQLAFKGDDSVSNSADFVTKKTPEKGAEKVQHAEKVPRASPKLQALKKRSAARRTSVKNEVISRPSTAPAMDSNSNTMESSLRTQIDKLKNQLSEAEKEKEDASAEIRSLTQKHKEIEETTIKHYESIIENLETEVQSLGVKIQEAESLTLRQKILNAEGGSEEMKLTEAEFQALRKEIEEQEVLLKGYQSENESAILKLKQMKDEVREREEKMAEEHASYARDLIVLQEERRVDSQKTASWLREKLELQKQTNALKEELYQTETKNRTEIERLRREKQELEAKSAGVDLKQIEKEEELVKSVKAEMEKMKREHKAAQAELESKLLWYSENQEFVNQNTDLIKEQLDTISKLKQRLAKYEANKEDGSPESQMANRIKELEGEVAHLNQLLVKNNPNSLSALIQASKPSPEESVHAKELQSEIDAQKKKNAELMRKHESQLRALRQQHEKARIQERQGKQNGRVKELTKQLEDTRSHFGKKVKTLEKQLTEVRKEKVYYQDSLRETRRNSRLSESSQTAEREAVEALKGELDQAKIERDQLRMELKQTRESIPSQTDSVQRLEMQVQELTMKLGGLGQVQGNAPYGSHATVASASAYGQHPGSAYGLSASASKENYMDMGVLNRMRQLESEIAYLRGNNNPIKSNYSPEYIVLEEKLAQMDARQIAREEQWRAVMEETKNLASLQQNVMKQKWELAIRAKNAEIDRFRTELDAILFDVSNLQRKG